ncbi:hypothetical protein ACIO3O_04900 [Streptomyces sp. NPDC087440]|uniref:hypothetical protein n=1 Tax=Streptomyces sp. NPDC087440 TaxID=3365790 RepID=UPI003802AC31
MVLALFGLFVIWLGTRAASRDRGLRNRGVPVEAVCLERVHDGRGYDQRPKRVLCSHVDETGVERRWMVNAHPDFPEVGDRVALVYDARHSGVVERLEAMPNRFLTFSTVLYAVGALFVGGGALMIWG